MAPSIPIRKVFKNGRPKWEVDLRSINRGRKFLDTKSEAETHREQQLAEHQGFGSSILTLSDKDKVKFLDAKRRLSESGATIATAVEFYLKHKPRASPVGILEAKEACLEAKEKAGRKERTVRQLKYSIEAFIKATTRKSIGDVTSDDIESWIHSDPEWELRTRKGKLIDLSTFFSFCQRRGWIMVNPCANVEPITHITRRPRVLSVEVVAKVMASAKDHCPKAVPLFALGFFCGLRTSEILDLKWENVHIDQGTVDVPPEKKTSWRQVAISENCKAWLRPGGDLPVVNWQRRFDKVRDRAGIAEWPPNAMRHCFASYHLATHKNIALTAYELGHWGSPDMLRNHYREILKKEHGNPEDYWKIVP